MAKKEVKQYGLVSEKGEFKIYNSKLFKANVINNFRGRKIKVVVTEEKEVNSVDQKGYYFGVMLEIIVNHLEEQGMRYSKKKLDHHLRMNYLNKEEMDPVTGEITIIPLSLSEDKEEVDTSRMSEYWDAVAQWAAQDLGLYIPPPDPKKKKRNLKPKS